MSLNLPTPNKTPGDPEHTQDTNLIIEGINTLKSQVDGIPAGPQGPQGEPGTPGQNGEAATVTVANTLTSAPGSNASVTSSGTPQNVALTFTIPRGETGPAGATGAQGAIGPQGNPGTDAVISIGTTTTGPPESNAAVTNTGTTSNAVFNFTIPRGPQGEAANIGDATPQNLGTAGAGTSTSASRQDHVHNMPTASQVGADPAGSAATVAGNLTTHEGLTTNVHGITDTANLVYTDDARLSDVRTPADGSVTDAKIVSGGLATTSITGTAVVTGDSRLSDARTPTDGSVTDAKIVAGGLATTSITGTAVITTDARLSNQRIPVDGSVTDAKITIGGLSPSKITGTAVIDNDARLTDQRTPLDNSVTSDKIVDGTIVNADINASADIDPRKINAPRIHYATTQPSTGLAAGDIWVDSDGTA